MIQTVQEWFLGGDAAGTVNVHWVWGGSLGPVGAAAVVVVAGFAAGVYVWRLGSQVAPRSRALLAGLRAAAVMLVLFLLFDPALTGQRIDPGEQAVAIVFDDSRSMAIAAGDGLSRGQRVLDAYAAAGPGIEARLARQFRILHYRGGAGAQRLDAPSSLEFDQPVSRLTAAVEGAARDAAAGTDVAAVVLFSDGVEQPGPPLSTAALEATGIPVYTIGVDSDQTWRDLELESLAVKRSHFDKSPVAATLRVAAHGLAGETAVAEVLENGAPVVSERLSIENGETVREVRLEFVPARRDWIAYEARVRLAEADTGAPADAQSGSDRVAQNNARTFLVDNRERAFRILYLSGAPTWENKFFRRALEPDRDLEVTSLIRISRAEKTFEFRGRSSSLTNPLFEGFDETAMDQPRYDEAVFLRLGPGGSELTTGYPSEPETLYAYDLVIWGDIEHNFFSTAQLELTRNFVAQRGGTLLLLGGPRSFAEGGFRNTVIDSMLPVVLRAAEPNTRAQAATQRFTVQPTPEGLISGAWVLSPDPGANRELWTTLPNLFGLNAFTLTRAGASIMAMVDSPATGRDGQPFFAIQPYGEGRCAVLATGQTWPWHMGTDLDDDRFSRLWRQLVRTLVDGVAQPLAWRNRQEEYPLNEPVELEFRVRDAQYVPRPGAHMTVTLTSPGGETQALEVEESIEEAGVYTSRFVPTQPGAYGLAIAALDGAGVEVARLDERLAAVPDLREYRNAQYDPEPLQRLAQATGGRHFEWTEWQSFERHITVRDTGRTDHTWDRWPIWYWPPFLIALLGLLCAEWYLRRRKGQP